MLMDIIALILLIVISPQYLLSEMLKEIAIHYGMLSKAVNDKEKEL